MEAYPTAAVERAMKVQEVLLKAMSGQLKWFEAAEVIGVSARTMRRWRFRLERDGTDGLLDRRRRIPSPRRAPVAEVGRILKLYRERYLKFNVCHFYEIAQREHGVTLSYSFVKLLLQGARLVSRRRARGKHRQRRPRRECFGEMLHLDGSRHHWLALEPEQWQTLIAIVDDATGQLLHAQLWPNETRTAVMTALRAVFLEHGLPQQLYTDRAGWAARTPQAGGKPDDRTPTQVQRALAELGIEHLRAYSPQARGRSERINGTLQGRLVNEFRLHGLRTPEQANRYLRERYRAAYNARFAHPPADPALGFVPLGTVDLDQYLCGRAERVVARDNTVVLGKTVLQIPKQPGRRSCQGLRVTVRHHLEGHYSVSAGPRPLATYDSSGRLNPRDSGAPAGHDRRPTGSLRSRLSAWRQRPTHRSAQTGLSNPQPRKRPDHLSKPSGQITC